MFVLRWSPCWLAGVCSIRLGLLLREVVLQIVYMCPGYVRLVLLSCSAAGHVSQCSQADDILWQLFICLQIVTAVLNVIAFLMESHSSCFVLLPVMSVTFPRLLLLLMVAVCLFVDCHRCVECDCFFDIEPFQLLSCSATGHVSHCSQAGAVTDGSCLSVCRLSPLC